MRRIAVIGLGTALVSCNLPIRPLTPSPHATAVATSTPAPTPTPRSTPTPLPTLPATPLPGDLNLQAAALRPGFEGDLALVAERTRYWIEVRVDYEPPAARALIEGLARIRYLNTEPDPLSEVVVMLWPNDGQYRAEMSAGPALIQGELRPPIALAGGIAQRYELPRPVPSGEWVDLSLPFRITTSGPIGGSAPSRFGISQQVLFAPTAYPLLPLRREGEWVVDPAPPGGDTTTSEVSLYQVDLVVPPELAVVTTGTELEREELPDGSRRVSVVSGPARDFAFALGPLLEEIRQVGGVRVRGWALAQHRSDLGRMVEAAATQVRILSSTVGPYPYVELDLVDLPGAYGGIEYPGLVTVGTLGGPSLIHPTVHEVGHQWFYGLIGDDQLRQPWLDEGAATYTEVLYFEHTQGSGSATGLLSEFREQLRDHPDPELPIGLAVGEYASPREYGLFVYLKGALFFDALRAELGEDVFFGFLQSYFTEFRYAIASAADFQLTAEATCGCDLQDLFDLWVYEGGEVPGL